jgi:type I restriction enzyme, S subunit
VTLPKAWRLVPLGDLVEPKRPRRKPGDYPNLPFIGMEHVEAHSMRLLGTVPARTMKSSAVHFQPGDVLYGRLRPYLNKVYRPDFEGLCSAEFIVLPPSDQVDARYLQYFLNSAPFVGFASRLNTGDRPRIDFEQLRRYVVPIPPLKEQRRIVEVIDDQLSRLDAGSAGVEAASRKLLNYEHSLLHGATLGHIASKKSSSETQVEHAVLEHPLPELPDRWHWAKLGSIADIVGGVAKDTKKQTGADLIEVPYLRVANVQRGHLDLRVVTKIRVPAEIAKKLTLLSGDVLMNEGGDRDKLGRGWVWQGQIPDCIHQNHVFRVRVRDRILDPRFLSWHGNTFGRMWFQREGKQTTNLASISLSRLRQLPVPVPPLDEQREIVGDLERRLSVTSAIRAEIGHVRSKAKQLRAAILGAAFTGGLSLEAEAGQAGHMHEVLVGL